MNRAEEALNACIQKECYATSGPYSTRNIVGDYLEPIYVTPEFRIDYAPYYDYIEVLGLTSAEFEEFKEKYDRLVTQINQTQ